MKRKIWLAGLVLAVGLGLAGCDLKQLTSSIKTEQRAGAPSWIQEGNVYSKSEEYETPAGVEKNEFRLTVENGVVSQVEVGVQTEDKTSLKYQKDFDEKIKGLVVGKKLSELVAVDTVAGASLTTAAFNRAVSQL